MLEDLTTYGSLRKIHLSRSEAYYQRCRHYVSAGHKPICIVGCRVCDGARCYGELLKFYALRDSSTRPERESYILDFHQSFLC